MKIIDITPLVSVGKILFGMERDKVRDILGNYSEYKNQHQDKNTADCFDICEISYDNKNLVEFVMFHKLKDVELILGNKILTKMKKAEIIELFSNLDKNLSFENSDLGVVSIESNELGIACFFEMDFQHDENGNEKVIDKVETISVAVKNYWA